MQGASRDFKPERPVLPPWHRGALLQEPRGDEDRVVRAAPQFHHDLGRGDPHVRRAVQEPAPDLPRLGPLEPPERAGEQMDAGPLVSS